LEFKNVNPFNVVNFFWAVVSREEGGIYSFANPENTAGYIVVICPEYQLESLRKLARDLDRKGLNSGPGSTYKYVPLKHRSVADAGFRSVLSYHIGASGVLIPDVETNSILIFDAPEGYNSCIEFLNGPDGDQPIRQVELKVNVYEVNISNDGTLGLDFIAWKNGPGQALFHTRNFGATYNGDVGGAGHYDGRGSSSLIDYPSAFFDFLAAKGRAKAVTEARIMASNNRLARIEATENILYYGVSNDSVRQLNDRLMTGDQLSPAVSTVAGSLANINIVAPASVPPAPTAPVKAGVSLNITPIVGDQTVNIDWLLSVSSVQSYDGKGVPIVKATTDTGRIAVPNGQEITLGGVVRDEIVRTTKKVPLLGSLPIIGYIFGSEVSTNRRAMIVASVTPTVMSAASNVGDSDESVKGMVRADVVRVIPNVRTKSNK
jgi:type II secretory pathway component GspD/PulD (secretin)